MKKHYLLLSAALFLTGAAYAQGPGTELFISEYNEGAHTPGVNYGGPTNSTGNEKAVEIYNPTNSIVSLNAYSIRRYSNGAPLGSPLMEEERLVRRAGTGANTLNPRAAYVIANPEATLPQITNVASQYSAPRQNTPANTTTSNNIIQVGGTVWFNGDDAMALVRYPSGTAGQPNMSAGIIIDIIGSIGEQPPLQASPCAVGGNWSGFNPADDLPGTPPTHVFVNSANQSIIRRGSVAQGLRTNPPAQNVPGTCPPTRAAGGYNIADQWYMYSTAFNGPGGTTNAGGQLYDNLGNHNDYTGPYGTYQTTLGTLSKFDANISVYPNPAHGFATVEIKDAKVGTVTVINNLGQTITAEAKGQGQEKLTLNISALKPGLYFVQILSADGQTKIYKELVVQ
jgi:hypothetical protein